ncbi:MAG: carbohydrate kinase family protein [Anaerolineales bacterium]|nr:carbohydrate kinase family protein [Anaerolineales bacterium]
MKRFIIVGEVNVDIVVGGLHSLPVLGQELLCEDFQVLLGGSSANCGSWLSALGANVDFLGKVGCDIFGEFVMRGLEHRGIGTANFIQDPDLRTGACISLSYPRDRALITYLGSITALCLDDINLDLLEEYDHLHSASIFLQHGLRPGLIELYRAAKMAGLTTSLDCGWDPEELWELDTQNLLDCVDYFLPNEVEAQYLTSASTTDQALTILSQYADSVIVKLGEDGAVTQQEGNVWRAPGFDVSVVDTTSAGDCFNAGFLYARIEQDRSIEDSMIFANACGAIAVTTFGGASEAPSSEEVDAFIEGKL